MTKKFNSVFGKLNIEAKTMNVFGCAEVKNVSVDNNTKQMIIDMEVPFETNSEAINNLEYELLRELPFINTLIINCTCMTEPPEKHFNLNVCIEKVMEITGNHSPLCRILLDNADFNFENNLFTIDLKNCCSFLFIKHRLDRLIEQMVKNEFDLNVMVRFLDSDTKTNSTISVIAAPKPVYSDNLTKKEEYRKIDLIQSKPKMDKSSSGSDWQNSFNKRRKSGIAIKKEIKGVVTTLNGAFEEGEEVVVEGMIFGIDKKETKTGKLLCQFNLTDFTDSITVKFFLPDGEKEFKENFAETIVNGNGVKVFGVVRYDEFLKELSLMAREICVTGFSKTKRVDNYPLKRVELHLHTQMSQMDALNSITDYVNQAREWGMDAIALTDHGVVQAFPEAMKAAKSSGVKVIYGMEAYLCDDMGAIVKNPGNYTLDDKFVVFDIETTGLQKESCSIIEIGAVKIENGQITDRFGSFVNPHIPLPEKIIKLTGITDDMLKDAQNIESVLPEFLHFVGDAILCAHNAAFDIGFISYNALKLGINFSYSSICTLELSRLLLPNIPSHSLNKVVEHLGISLKNHHRAVDDAEATAEIFLSLRNTLLSENSITSLKEINIIASGNIDVKKLPYYHAVILVKNQEGLRNLYELVSLSHLKYYSKRPRIPKSLLSKKREGLILGTACESGEFYKAVLENRSEEYLKELADFYDYLEIQCHENNMYLYREGKVSSPEALKEINRKIVNLGDKYHKPVVATCDVHFQNPNDSIYREIIMTAEGFKDANLQAPLYFRTTDEMLREFDYLPPKKAEEVVIHNTRKIADMVEIIKPIPDGTFPPEIEGAEDDLKQITMSTVYGIYGNNPPEIVQNRISREMDSIVKHGFSVMYVIAQKLVHRSLENGYLVGSRGSVGSSLAATMSGITEVNPLPAHYYCPECKFSDFDSEAVSSLIKNQPGLSGCDMPDRPCPICGTALKKDGHDIPFETFLGFDGDKEPDIDLNFSGEYQSQAHAYTEELFGKGYVFKAGTIGTLAEKTAYGYVSKFLTEKNQKKRSAEVNRLISGITGIKRTTGQHPGGLMIVPKGLNINQFCPVQHPANDQNTDVITTHFDYHSMEGRLLKLDILGHDVPTIIRMLHDITGLDPRNVDIGDKKIMSLFSSPEALGVSEVDINCKTGTLGIPEFGTSFVRQMLLDTRPNSFTELVKISGLSHGTDVWYNNAHDLIKNKTASFSEIITTRDDIMIYLISKGVEKKPAFTIMEKVRKGKGLSAEEENLMRQADIPEWYISSCQKIKYLFPKSHAVAYVMMSIRIAYYKIHYPYAFYAACFSVKTEDFDYEIMCRGKETAKAYQTEIINTGKDATAKEKNMLTTLELVIEMYGRGLKFTPMDLYESSASKFKVTSEGLMPPLCTLQGLGENAAIAIVEARKDGEFISLEDFKVRTKTSKTVLELIIKNGILKGIPKTNQLSLF